MSKKQNESRPAAADWIAIVDTDGLGLVVWGLGRSLVAAQRDAKKQARYRHTELAAVVFVDEDRAKLIRSGYIKADDLVARKAGRPAVAGSPRSVVLKVRITQAENLALALIAKGHGVGVSEYVRQKVLGGSGAQLAVAAAETLRPRRKKASK